MRKITLLPALALALATAACGSSPPAATPADATVCHQYFTVMGTQPATHTLTWLDGAFQSDPQPDPVLAADMTAWLELMESGGAMPGSGEQNQTAQAAYNIQQYCDSIHEGS
jgi:hypothetical protein